MSISDASSVPDARVESENEADRVASSERQQAEAGVGGKAVKVRSRTWLHIDADLHDPGSFVASGKTRIRRPPSLQLGELSFSHYFYLMYPEKSLPTTLRETNRALEEARKKLIGTGDYFRWIGIRLAMAL